MGGIGHRPGAGPSFEGDEIPGSQQRGAKLDGVAGLIERTIADEVNASGSKHRQGSVNDDVATTGLGLDPQGVVAVCEIRGWGGVHLTRAAAVGQIFDVDVEVFEGADIFGFVCGREADFDVANIELGAEHLGAALDGVEQPGRGVDPARHTASQVIGRHMEAHMGVAVWTRVHDDAVAQPGRNAHARADTPTNQDQQQPESPELDLVVPSHAQTLERICRPQGLLALKRRHPHTIQGSVNEVVVGVDAGAQHHPLGLQCAQHFAAARASIAIDQAEYGGIVEFAAALTVQAHRAQELDEI